MVDGKVSKEVTIDATLSLNDVSGDFDNMTMPGTPRTMEAYEKSGYDPKDLVYRPLNYYKKKYPEKNFGKIAFEYKEEERMKKVNELKKVYKKIVKAVEDYMNEEQNNEDEKSKTTRDVAKSNNKTEMSKTIGGKPSRRSSPKRRSPEKILSPSLLDRISPERSSRSSSVSSGTYSEKKELLERDQAKRRKKTMNKLVDQELSHRKIKSTYENSLKNNEKRREKEAEKWAKRVKRKRSKERQASLERKNKVKSAYNQKQRERQKMLKSRLQTNTRAKEEALKALDDRKKAAQNRRIKQLEKIAQAHKENEQLKLSQIEKNQKKAEAIRKRREAMYHEKKRQMAEEAEERAKANAERLEKSKKRVNQMHDAKRKEVHERQERARRRAEQIEEERQKQLAEKQKLFKEQEELRKQRLRQAELIHKHKMSHLQDMKDKMEARHNAKVEQLNEDLKKKGFMKELQSERNRKKIEEMKKRQEFLQNAKLQHTEDKIDYINDLKEEREELAKLAKEMSEKNTRSRSRIREYLSSMSEDETFKIPDWLGTDEKAELKRMLNKRGVSYMETKKVGAIPEDTYRRLTRKRTSDREEKSPTTPKATLKSSKPFMPTWNHQTKKERQDYLNTVKENTRLFSKLSLKHSHMSPYQKRKVRRRSRKKKKGANRFESHSEVSHTNADDVEYMKRHKGPESDDIIEPVPGMELTRIDVGDNISENVSGENEEMEEVPLPKLVAGDLEFNIGSVSNIRHPKLAQNPEPYVEAKIR